MERELKLQKHLVIQPPLDREDKSQWVNVMDGEMDSLSANKVWDLAGLPEDRKIVGSKWVFKTKKDVHGKIERYQA